MPTSSAPFNVNNFTLFLSDVGGVLHEGGAGEAGLQASLSRWPEWPPTILIPSRLTAKV